jgi:transcriptional regulator with XRE-family HTH domain
VNGVLLRFYLKHVIIRAYYLALKEMHMEKIGVRVEKYRVAAGLSLRELARRMDMSPGNIHNIEKYQRGLHSGTLVHMAQVLHCTPHDLLGWGEAKPETE